MHIHSNNNDRDNSNEEFWASSHQSAFANIHLLPPRFAFEVRRLRRLFSLSSPSYDPVSASIMSSTPRLDGTRRSRNDGVGVSGMSADTAALSCATDSLSSSFELRRDRMGASSRSRKLTVFSGEAFSGSSLVGASTSMLSSAVKRGAEYLRWRGGFSLLRRSERSGSPTAASGETGAAAFAICSLHLYRGRCEETDSVDSVDAVCDEPTLSAAVASTAVSAGRFCAERSARQAARARISIFARSTPWGLRRPSEGCRGSEYRIDLCSLSIDGSRDIGGGVAALSR